jgi:hypothetical protein
LTDQPKIDPQSETWRAITNFVNARLRAERTAVETPGTPHPETEAHRAVIVVLKEIRGMAQPPAFETSETMEGTSDAIDG